MIETIKGENIKDKKSSGNWSIFWFLRSGLPALLGKRHFFIMGHNAYKGYSFKSIFYI